MSGLFPGPGTYDNEISSQIIRKTMNGVVGKEERFKKLVQQEA
jgi:hypothetical protein